MFALLVDNIVKFGVTYFSAWSQHFFFGLAGYCRSFYKNFAAVAALLTKLLCPKVPFVWTKLCLFAFWYIERLASAPVPAAPDCNKPFKLAVDASGAGARLSSFRMTKRGDSWSEKPGRSGFESFWLYMCQTTVVDTDRSPLVFLSRIRVSRWRLFLQGFELDMQQVAGKTTRSVMLFQGDLRTSPPVSPGFLSPAGSQAILSSTQSLSLSLQPGSATVLPANQIMSFSSS